MAESRLRKAVVLCAGEGTRLRPLTFARPKHMLPVANRPLLGWALESLVAGRVVNQVTVDPDVARWAKVALDQMLALPGETAKD